MHACTRSFILVNGRTKISQTDKLLPRGFQESLTPTMAMTITVTPSTLLPLPRPPRYFRFSSVAVFASSNLTRLSLPFCTLNTTTDSSLVRFSRLPIVCFSASIMGKNPQEEVKKDQQRDGHDGKAAGDYSNRGADDILPNILNMYASHASAKDFEIYAPNATFEDPLMRAEGVKQIKSAFYSLGKVVTLT